MSLILFWSFILELVSIVDFIYYLAIEPLEI